MMKKRELTGRTDETAAARKYLKKMDVRFAFNSYIAAVNVVARLPYPHVFEKGTLQRTIIDKYDFDISEFFRGRSLMTFNIPVYNRFEDNCEHNEEFTTKIFRVTRWGSLFRGFRARGDNIRRVDLLLDNMVVYTWHFKMKKGMAITPFLIPFERGVYTDVLVYSTLAFKVYADSVKTIMMSYGFFNERACQELSCYTKFVWRIWLLVGGKSTLVDLLFGNGGVSIL